RRNEIGRAFFRYLFDKIDNRFLRRGIVPGRKWILREHERHQRDKQCGKTDDFHATWNAFIDNDLKPTLPGNGTLVPLEKKTPNVVVRRFTRRHDIPQNEITTAWLPIATAPRPAIGL